MPRKAREMSETGIYHVLLRGIDNREIFENNEDKQKFINIMLKKRDVSDFNLYAFCVMDNHVHLAVKEDQGILSSCIKGISIGYVSYFNKKYGKSGPLFYDRFKSEAIGDEAQLLAVIRFIHNNPVKAGIEKEPCGYEWSSAGSYISEPVNTCKSENFKNDVNEILSLFSQNRKDAVSAFVKFTKSDEVDIFCDYDVLDRDLEMMRNKYLANEVIKRSGIGDDAFASNREALRSVILKLRNEHNISLRQIAEILKLNRGLVQRLSAP